MSEKILAEPERKAGSNKRSRVYGPRCRFRVGELVMNPNMAQTTERSSLETNSARATCAGWFWVGERVADTNPRQTAPVSAIESGIQMRDVGRKNDAVLDKISRRLEQQTGRSELFAMRWRVT